MLDLIRICRVAMMKAAVLDATEFIRSALKRELPFINSDPSKVSHRL